MTDFETATITYQIAALELQAIATWSGLMIGLAQCALIAAGLWMMNRASNRRDRQIDQAEKEAERRHDEAMTALRNQHVTTMKALEALIERTAPDRGTAR